MSRRAEAGLLLGLDIGTTRTKAVITDAAGAEVVAAAVATPFAASPGGVDMAVDDLVGAVRAAVGALGSAREHVAAVGLAGMAESGAPFSAGRPAAPVIAWHDGRGEATVTSLERRFGPPLVGWTGRRVRTVSSVAKLGWLVDHGLPPPDRWLGVPEMVLFLLTGAEATEHSLAARTGAYHVVERRFLPEVITHVLGWSDDLAERLFPPVQAAGTTMGFVRAEAAETYGLPAGIPVTIAGHDHLAAAAGLGARPDDLLNSVGTAETLIRRLDDVPDIDRAVALDLAVTVWPGGEAWGVLASAARSGLVVEAVARHAGADPGRLDALAAGRSAAPAGGSAAASPGAPDGGQAIEMPAGPVGSSGGRLDLGQGIEVPVGPAAEMWVATLQALARRTAAAAERVSAVAGPHRRVVVFGGGSRSPVWLRLKEAELRVPVVPVPRAEAAARGAALAAGVAAGWWPSTAAGPVPPLGGRGDALSRHCHV